MRLYYPLDWSPEYATRSQQYLERASGFREVIEAALGVFQEHRPLHDYALGPIVFLLRHWIELQLKGIITYIREIEGVDVRPVKGHNIKKLYRKATEIAKEFALNRGLTYPLANPEVERFVNLLGKYDPKGEVFRYPETLDGQPVFREPMNGDLYDRVMTVDGLTASCTLVFGDLEGLEGWLDFIKENEEEVRREGYDMM